MKVQRWMDERVVTCMASSTVLAGAFVEKKSRAMLVKFSVAKFTQSANATRLKRRRRTAKSVVNLQALR